MLKTKTPNELAAEFNEFMEGIIAKTRLGRDAIFEEDLTELHERWEELRRFLKPNQESELQDVIDNLKAGIRRVLDR